MYRSTSFVALLLAATCVCAAESRTDDFIKEAIEGNLFEVKAGELAQAKGESSGVKQFGAMLAKDHAAAATKAVAAAKAIGATPPKQPSKSQQGVLDAMAKLNGEAFDAHFIDSMLQDHLRDVQRYETQAKHGDDAVAKYAADTLPALRDHLKSVQGLQNERSTR